MDQDEKIKNLERQRFALIEGELETPNEDEDDEDLDSSEGWREYTSFKRNGRDLHITLHHLEIARAVFPDRLKDETTTENFKSLVRTCRLAEKRNAKDEISFIQTLFFGEDLLLESPGFRVIELNIRKYRLGARFDVTTDNLAPVPVSRETNAASPEAQPEAQPQPQPEAQPKAQPEAQPQLNPEDKHNWDKM